MDRTSHSHRSTILHVTTPNIHNINPYDKPHGPSITLITLMDIAHVIFIHMITLGMHRYEESNQIGGLHESYHERKTFARQSLGYNLRNEIYVSLFCGEQGAINPKLKTNSANDENKSAGLLGHQAGGGADNDDDEEGKPTCRFCHNSGDLVEPCDCKGSSRYVHLACLQQWQRSVLMTQSTHPKYQTNIDRVCNVCGVAFRYKARSRRQQMIEFTGAELGCSIILVTYIYIYIYM